MMRTGYEAEEFETPGRWAPGPRPRPRVPSHARGWAEVGVDPAGAFAPMGGIFSCVTDLARWVTGFAAAFRPGEPRPACGSGAARYPRECSCPRS